MRRFDAKTNQLHGDLATKALQIISAAFGGIVDCENEQTVMLDAASGRQARLILA